MRVPDIALGLVVGGALGFALHAWLAPDGEGARPEVLRAPGDAGGEASLGRALQDAPRPDEPRPAAAPIALAPAALPPAHSAADALVGILVHGAVLDTDGRPIDSRQRWMFFDNGAKPLVLELGPTSTYAISGLRPGSLTISTDFVGYRPCERSITLRAEEPVVRVDLVLEPAVTLVVKGFTPTGEPLMDAVVRELSGGVAWRAPRMSAIATLEPPTGDLPPISDRAYTSWGVGTYSDRLDSSWKRDGDLPLDALGRLELDGALPVFVSLAFRHVLLATQRVDPGTQEVVFTVSLDSLAGLLGSVRVRVVDAETQQVPDGLEGSLDDSQTGGRGLPAAADGSFTWERQRPGLLELEVTAPGYESWDQDVLVPSGGTTDLGSIELTREVTLSGHVVDTVGRPVAVELQALRDDLASGVGMGMGARRSFASDAEGAFSISTLGRHPYRLVVSTDAWAAAPVFVDARQGDVDGVRVVVERGALLHVRTGWPRLDTYDLRITSAAGALLASTRSFRGGWTWSRRLPAGDYTLTLLRDGKELRRHPVTLAAEDLALDVAP